MAPRSLAFGLLFFGAPSALAGGAHWESGEAEFRPRAFHLSGHVKTLVLTNRQGRTTRVPLPASRDLSQGLPVPAGDWAELTITLDGPVYLLGGAAGPVLLPMETLTVPLVQPDSDAARVLFVALALPEGLRGPALRAAVVDGAVAVDGERRQ